MKRNWKYTFKISMYVIFEFTRICLCICLPNNKFRPFFLQKLLIYDIKTAFLYSCSFS